MSMKIIINTNPFTNNNKIRVKVKESSISVQLLLETYCVPKLKKYGHHSLESLKTGTTVTVNGMIIPASFWETYIIKGDDFVMISPIVSGGDGSGKMILNIFLLIVSFGMLGPGIFGITGMGLTGINLMFAVAGVAMLLNVLTPAPSTPKLNSGDIDDSQMYGWNPQTTQKQGSPIPVNYGENKVFGNVIATYIETNDEENKQILNVLLCLGQGPVEAVTEMKVNEQDIDNFTELSYEIRNGDLGQTVISNFNDTKVENMSISSVVEYGTPKVISITNIDADDLEFMLDFPRGIYYTNPKSGLAGHTIGYKIELKNISVGSDWVIIVNEQVSKKTVTTSYKKFKTIDIPALAGGLIRGDDYDMRITKTTAEMDETKYGDQIRIYSYTKVTRSDFCYPTLNLVGIKAVSTEQLYGSFQFSCILKGKIVAVYNGTAWSWEYSNNPAWVLWDLLTKPVLDGDGSEGDPYTIAQSGGVDYYEGMNPQLDTDNPRLNLASFYEWAQWCDGLVVSGESHDITGITRGATTVISCGSHDFEAGDVVFFTEIGGTTELNGVFGTITEVASTTITVNIDSTGYGAYTATTGIVHHTEKRIQFNGGFDVSSSTWESALKVCETGRALPYWNGIELYVVIDKPSSPTMMFSHFNILEGSFKETFLPYEELANEIEVQFMNQDADYTKTPITIFNSDMNRPNNKVILDTIGITKASEAWRSGMLRLRKNELLRRTIDFEAGIDAIACIIGDVVYIQHDVANWGEMGSGSVVYNTNGRLVSGTSDTATFAVGTTFEDADFNGGDTTYEVMIRMSDDSIETRIISDYNDETKTITVSVPFTETPVFGNGYVIGVQNLVTKEFRIIAITPTEENNFKITAVEYNEDIYKDDYLIPMIPDYNALAPLYDSLIVGNLTLVEYQNQQESGVILRNIEISWDLPVVVSWAKAHIYYKTAINSTWTKAGEIDGTNFKLYSVTPETTYYIKVVSENSNGIRTPFETSPEEDITTTSVNANISDTLDVIVTGLKIDGGSTTVFTGKDIHINWDNVKDPYPVVNITKASGQVIVVTMYNHPFNTGDVVEFESIVGSTELNGHSYTITKVTDHTFSLDGTGATSITAYVSGGNGFIIETGGEPYSNPSWVKSFQIVVKNGSDTVLRTEDVVNQSSYVYPYDYNIIDTSGSPIRTVKFEVKVRDFNNRLSATATSITVTNSAPTTITSTEVATTPILNGIMMEWPIANDIDLVGYKIWGSKTSPVDTTDDDDLIFKGTANTFSFYPESTGTWYFKIAAYDAFGETGLNISNQFTDATSDTSLLTDVPLPSGATWTSNSPSAGYVAWNAFTILYKGTTYSISAGNSNKQIIYFDSSASATVLQTTDDIATAVGINKWVQCYNSAGTALPTFSSKIINAGLIQASSLSAISANLGSISSGTITLTLGATQRLRIDSSGIYTTIDSGTSWQKFLGITDGEVLLSFDGYAADSAIQGCYIPTCKSRTSYVTWAETALTNDSTDRTVVGSNRALGSNVEDFYFNIGIKSYDSTPANDDTIILVPFIKDKNGNKVWEGDSLFMNEYSKGWRSVNYYLFKTWKTPELVKLGIVIGDNYTAGFTYNSGLSSTSYYKGWGYYGNNDKSNLYAG